MYTARQTCVAQGVAPVAPSCRVGPQVMGRDVPLHLLMAQQRLLAPGGDLTPEERAELRHMLCPWDTHADVFGGRQAARPLMLP